MQEVDRYHVLELIGEGSFGRVYKGRRKFSKQVCHATHLAHHPPRSFADRGSQVYIEVKTQRRGAAEPEEGGGDYARVET